MTRPLARTQTQRLRRGLAPLEFVLALPVLLMVMGLIINFGTVASWKVRGLSAARHALWSNRTHRSGGSFPRPESWPAGVMGVGGMGLSPALDDARVDRPVVRGPMIGDFGIRHDWFDPTRGMLRGHSALSRSYPLLRSLGSYRLESETQALDDRWQWENTDLDHSWERRIPVLYDIRGSDEVARRASRYIDAVAAIWYAPFRRSLWPMDNDQEFIYWGRRFMLEGILGWSDAPPDFYREHAWLEEFCHLDESDVKTLVERLIDRIQGKTDDTGNLVVDSIAEYMRKRFRDFFERVIRELERQLSAVPPPPPSVASDLKHQIAVLRGKIAQLSDVLR